MFATVFNIILYKPIFNVFVFLYNIIPGHDVGVVILVLTLLIKVILYPLTNSGIKAQKSLQDLQPKVEELKKRYANDKQALAQATMELYKNNKVNPFSSCLPLLLQLPIIFALYAVFRDGLASHNVAVNLYPFIHNPETINSVSLGFVDLSKPNYILAILAGVAQFFQTRSMTKKTARPPKVAGEGGKDEDMMSMMNKQMLYFMPIMTVLIGLRLPSGLALYWFLSTVIMSLQQYIVAKQNPPATPPSTPSQPPQDKVIEGQIVGS